MVPRHEATWLNEPQHTRIEGTDLLVNVRGRSDFWRTTSYGFVRDDGRALLHDLPRDSATEVTFVADFETLHDQAGLMIRVDAETWIKAGVEMSDGLPQLGAVVTRGERPRTMIGPGPFGWCASVTRFRTPVSP